MDKAIFLDRDGVINSFTPEGDPDKPGTWNYVLSWDDFHFAPGALEALNLLAATDYRIFVVSNQSCIGRELVDYEVIYDIFVQMLFEIDKAGGDIFDFRFCPHAPNEGCVCRKPKPGLIYYLATEYSIDLSKSWMIGDSESDMECADNAGIPRKQTVKIGPFVGTALRTYETNLLDAVKRIIDKGKDASL
jgi:D-glycero-D-manno-heptose 1,7-bisphosphate phosphatase